MIIFSVLSAISAVNKAVRRQFFGSFKQPSLKERLVYRARSVDCAVVDFIDTEISPSIY